MVHFVIIKAVLDFLLHFKLDSDNSRSNFDQHDHANQSLRNSANILGSRVLAHTRVGTGRAVSASLAPFQSAGESKRTASKLGASIHVLENQVFFQFMAQCIVFADSVNIFVDCVLFRKISVQICKRIQTTIGAAIIQAEICVRARLQFGHQNSRSSVFEYLAFDMFATDGSELQNCFQWHCFLDGTIDIGVLCKILESTSHENQQTRSDNVETDTLRRQVQPTDRRHQIRKKSER